MQCSDIPYCYSKMLPNCILTDHSIISFSKLFTLTIHIHEMKWNGWSYRPRFCTVKPELLTSSSPARYHWATDASSWYSWCSWCVHYWSIRAKPWIIEKINEWIWIQNMHNLNVSNHSTLCTYTKVHDAILLNRVRDKMFSYVVYIYWKRSP